MTKRTKNQDQGQSTEQKPDQYIYVGGQAKRIVSDERWIVTGKDSKVSTVRVTRVESIWD